MSLPMNSILEELRCMDGEIFRSELTQRLYILLKVQAQETIDVSGQAKKQIHSKILEWPAAVRDEELNILRKRSSEIDSLFTQVALLYVKLSHKAVENRTVRIRTPRLEDMVRLFYQNIISNPWCVKDELWKFDPIKLDFVLRECFRKAVMDSVQVIRSSAATASVVSSNSNMLHKAPKRFEDDDEIYPDDSISSFLQPEQEVKPKEIVPTNAENNSIDSQSTSSTSSSDSFRQDGGTIVQSKNLNDSQTVYYSSNNYGNDNLTVAKSTVKANDSKTVTFNLPKGPGSVTSSISETSSSSKYMTATSKPVFTPIEEKDDSEEEKEEVPVLKVQLSSNVELE
jgi:hypothetical protein